MREPKFKVFSVDEDILTQKICSQLQITPGVIKIDTFSDGEFSPQFKETIRNHQVFLICSTNTPEKILKMLLTIDAAKRASASEIVAVIPFFGYARQDRKEGSRGAIGAKAMADILSAVGINRLITIDLHAAQIQGFFNTPVDHINGYNVFSSYLKKITAGSYTICSPDAGGVKRASAMYNKFSQYRTSDCDINFAMMSKRRDKPNSIESMELIGDVAGRNVILVDDMTDTAGTLMKAAEILKTKGALSVHAIVSHAVLSGNARQNVIDNKNLDRLIISDSINAHNEDTSLDKITVISCADAFAKAIKNVSIGKSLHEVFS